MYAYEREGNSRTHSLLLRRGSKARTYKDSRKEEGRGERRWGLGGKGRERGDSHTRRCLCNKTWPLLFIEENVCHVRDPDATDEENKVYP